MASKNKGKDTVSKGMAYTIIGVLVFLCVGVFGFVGWGAIQFLGNPQNQNPVVTTTTTDRNNAENLPIQESTDNPFDDSGMTVEEIAFINDFRMNIVIPELETMTTNVLLVNQALVHRSRGDLLELAQVTTESVRLVDTRMTNRNRHAESLMDKLRSNTPSDEFDSWALTYGNIYLPLALELETRFDNTHTALSTRGRVNANLLAEDVLAFAAWITEWLGD